jgi:hypothetical protein
MIWFPEKIWLLLASLHEVFVLLHHAPVHDHLDAGLAGFFRRLVVNDAQLHPHGLDPHADALIDNLRDPGRIEEEVRHVNIKGDVFQGLIAGSVQYLLCCPGFTGTTS